MKIQSEIELCEKFIAAHPRAEHLYFEVHLPGGRADIVHSENKIITIYEAKKRLSLELLEQCINRKSYAHFVYAVVPEVNSRNYFLESLFGDYGIGVISIRTEEIRVDKEGDQKIKSWRYMNIPILREHAKAKFFRTPKKITLYEENKKEIAGSKSSGITPFAIMVKNIKEQLSRGKKNVDYIFKHQTYYGTLKQFKTNIYAWIRNGVITGIEMEKGELWLTENKPNE